MNKASAVSRLSQDLRYSHNLILYVDDELSIHLRRHAIGGRQSVECGGQQHGAIDGELLQESENDDQG